jgi:septum site-determining protein MinC
VTPERRPSDIDIAEPRAEPPRATPANGRDAPFQLRGNTFSMVLLKVVDPLHPRFLDLLAEKVGQAPDFFRNAPVVLDLDALPPDVDVDLCSLTRALRARGLVAVSLQGGTTPQQERAVEAGLTLLARRGERPAPVERPAEPAESIASRRTREAPTAEPPAITTQPSPGSTRIVTEPVRSGRQIYVPNGDLIVCAPVSAGAELAADGSIHVYGTLRGRALAGASGDASARIFCQSLEAELVAIAGTYVVSEDMANDLLHRPVQIHVEHGSLRMNPISL